MNLKKRTIKIVSVIIFATTLFQTASCGTILYPERRGQTRGRIDPAVAILDGLGLFLFLIPGIVAFAVDFTTGAIYLPEDKESTYAPIDNKNLKNVKLDMDTINKNILEGFVKRETGINVSLDDQNLKVYRVTDSELKNMDFSKVIKSRLSLAKVPETRS